MQWFIHQEALKLSLPAVRIFEHFRFLNPILFHSPKIPRKGSGWGGHFSIIGFPSKEKNGFPKKFPKVQVKFSLPFLAGWMGWLSYEGISHMQFCDRAFLRDEVKKRWWLVAAAESSVSLKRKICELKEFLISLEEFKRISEPIVCAGLRSNLSKRSYSQKIAKIKHYLLDGETYQVNFSRKFEANFRGDPWDMYCKLTRVNPSPKQFYWESKNRAVISNSPETLLCGFTKGGQFFVETRPVKGTVRRERTQREDRKQIQKLLESEKDRAELTMIVDLERHDLGKICLPNSIILRKHRAIERYSHVIHTVSDIRGILRPGTLPWEALQALFPGGSVTGCPKKRTMEIIRELEGEERNAYCGSAGFISLHGSFDFNILIRTIECYNSKLTFRSGGGIVIDSDPNKEYEETEHKAGAMMTILQGP